MTARAGTASRDPLGCRFELRHFGVWRSVVGVAAIAALAVLIAWLASGTVPRSVSAMVAAALAAAAVVLTAVSLVRTSHGDLCREGGSWSFAPLGSGAGATETGELVIAIDLGVFMLLVLRRPGRVGRRWLPVQRSGQEMNWHALRCAARAPRVQVAALPARPE